jgi:hypothetical protein
VRVASRNGLVGEVAGVAVVCAAVAAIVCAVGVRAAESVASNLDLMTRLTADVATELYGKFGSSLGDRPVVVRPYGNSEDYVFVANVFTGELMRAGVRTLSDTGGAAPVKSGNAAFDSLQAQNGAAPTPPPAGALLLKFQNTAFELSYPDAYRSHLVGGRKIRRSASVRVFATLTDADSGEVLWTGEAQRSQDDEFDKDDAARVENGTYAFVHPTVPSGGWGKYVEPVFVTGIVVGLIYLFFANQSDN